jgi:multisubunit Na+/H+ antiporter MnhG subunit
MPWWLDLVLLVSAVAFWWGASREADDVWGLLKHLLALVALAVVLLGGRQVLLELLALALALWLPSSTSPHLWSRSAGRRFGELQQRSRSVRGSSSAMAPSASSGG